MLVLMRENFLRVDRWRSIMAVPISSSPAQANRGPTSVVLPAGAGGLTSDSVALCHQLTTLDRGKFERRLGELSAEQLQQVEEGVLLALGIAGI
jgi:mRNA interferase MazF